MEYVEERIEKLEAGTGIIPMILSNSRPCYKLVIRKQFFLTPSKILSGYNINQTNDSYIEIIWTEMMSMTAEFLIRLDIIIADQVSSFDFSSFSRNVTVKRMCSKTIQQL
ncbi:MAG: hypothetical protein ACREBS_02010 [Nitrososphaerales archaeon]